MEKTAGIYVQGKWKDVQRHIQRFLHATSLILCIDLVGTSENRIRCAKASDLHFPYTNQRIGVDSQ
jgi:hypothetical protein